MSPIILAIDTSADETSIAVTQGRKVLSNVRFSQIAMHQQYGGIYPTIAKRAHEEKFASVLSSALKKSKKQPSDIDFIAVTYGPGLAPALDVGLRKAKELAIDWNVPVIPVNHMEGHIYSCYGQNSRGNPDREIVFPCIAFLVSGGHTEMVYMKDFGSYEIIGKTRDDAAGECLDKAARMLTGGGYPGGPIIERLALLGDPSKYVIPVPMLKSGDLNFSYSGIKTALLNLLKKISETEKEENIENIAATFQKAVFDSLEKKLVKAIEKYTVDHVLVGGGVSANKTLRKRFRKLAKEKGLTVLFPPVRPLEGDNGAMIGIAAYFAWKEGRIVEKKDFQELQRVPRLSLDDVTGQ